MNLTEYSFESTGVSVIKGAIDDNTVEQARKLIADNWPHKGPPWKFPLLHLGRVFWEMMTHPLVLDLAGKFAGDYFRMDHAFGVHGRGAVKQLHGGPQSSQHSCFYVPASLDGRSGLFAQLNFGFTLYGQSPSTGGFCYVPGSHKSVDPRAGQQLLNEVYKGDMSHPSIVVPTLEPGDLMLFSEGLVHGDTLWRGKGQSRLQIYYRITPGWMCWRDPAQTASYLEYAKTDLERRMIEPPWTGRYTEDAKSMGIDNTRRPPTRPL